MWQLLLQSQWGHGSICEFFLFCLKIINRRRRSCSYCNFNYKWGYHFVALQEPKSKGGWLGQAVVRTYNRKRADSEGEREDWFSSSLRTIKLDLSMTWLELWLILECTQTLGAAVSILGNQQAVASHPIQCYGSGQELKLAFYDGTFIFDSIAWVV